MPTSTTNPSYDIRFSRRTKPPLPPLPSPHIRDSKYEEIHDGRNAGPSLLDEAGYLVPAPV